jgi:TetR/AcrR family transcriptional repressor of nem operon
MARPLEFDKNNVAERAMCVFLRHGYEGASVEDLTRELDISRASLYNSFGDKRGLMLAALACAEPGSAADALGTVLRRIVALHRQGITPPGCLMLQLGTELASTDAEVQARVERNLDGQRHAFRLLAEREGRWSAAECDAIAGKLVGHLTSLMVLVRVYPKPEVLEAIIRDAENLLRK